MRDTRAVGVTRGTAAPESDRRGRVSAVWSAAMRLLRMMAPRANGGV